LKPSNKLELGALFTSYCLHKWRFQISDFFGQYWHSLSGSQLDYFYKAGNRITTRKAEDEYFFKAIPNKAEHIEFIFPTSLNELIIRDQLREWISTSQKFAPKLAFFSLLLPANFFVAKVLGVIPANFFFTYHVFRLNATFRAMYGSKRLQTLVDTNRVSWTKSDELESQIERISRSVIEENHLTEWKYMPGKDLHDLVIYELSKELKLPQLSQSIRRSRMYYFVHKQ
jgi:hypothetical protein